MRTAIAFGILASLGGAAYLLADDRQPPPAPQPSGVDEGLPVKKQRIDPSLLTRLLASQDDAKPKAAKREAADADLPAAAPKKEIDNVEHALESPSFADFSETPLSAALQFMGTQHNIRIHLDEPGLANAMVDKESPVTIRLAGVRLALILDLLFEPLTLDYTVRENVLFISSRERIQNMRETVVVRIGDILPDGADPTALASRLQELITENVDRDSWIPNGGENTIQFVEDAKSFVVTSNGRTQRKVAKLLNDLRAARVAQGMPAHRENAPRVAVK